LIATSASAAGTFTSAAGTFTAAPPVAFPPVAPHPFPHSLGHCVEFFFVQDTIAVGISPVKHRVDSLGNFFPFNFSTIVSELHQSVDHPGVHSPGTPGTTFGSSATPSPSSALSSGPPWSLFGTTTAGWWWHPFIGGQFSVTVFIELFQQGSGFGDFFGGEHTVTIGIESPEQRAAAKHPLHHHRIAHTSGSSHASRSLIGASRSIGTAFTFLTPDRGNEQGRGQQSAQHHFEVTHLFPLTLLAVTRLDLSSFENRLVKPIGNTELEIIGRPPASQLNIGNGTEKFVTQVFLFVWDLDYRTPVPSEKVL
jgi:hypothetical protein